MKRKLFLTITYLILSASLMLVATDTFGSWVTDADWYDESYQYRVPFTISPSSTGLTKITNLAADDIVDLINELEIIDYSDTYFDYNRLIIVAYSDAGAVLDASASSGFCMITNGSEMITNGSFSTITDSQPDNWSCSKWESFEVVTGTHDGYCLRVHSDTVSDKNRLYQQNLSVTSGAYYLLTWYAKSAQHAGNARTYLAKELDSWTELERSYVPRLFSKNWTQYEGLYKADATEDYQINIERRLNGEAFIDDVSMKKVNIELVVDVKATGTRKKYMIYYQPSQATQMIVPEKRSTSSPGNSLTANVVSDAERYGTRTRYTVATIGEALSYQNWCDIWFAETTQKISPDMSAPSNVKSRINISCAKN